MTKDEALKLALWHEAMAREPNRNQAKREKHEATAKFINEALAQPEQEPVAWGVFDDNLHDMFFAKEEAQEMVRLKNDGSTVKPLYTTPPQRTWVDLSDEERQEIALEVPIDAVLITEAKLKSKNNG